ncbi:peroxiredoxin [Amycolatopsis sp. NPDC052450]|uniref:peroxiredoxin n=1 Tax=Amycolatopsis sp. NPDC052450 TaxID=3363937 RepID=UPI0037C7957A
MDQGDLAPDFTLPDDTGRDRTLSDFLTVGPVVLFFYPAAMTGGCTAESCHFRDLAAEFTAVGAHRGEVRRPRRQGARGPAGTDAHHLTRQVERVGSQVREGLLPSAQPEKLDLHTVPST